MSTIRATYVQHGSSSVPNITLNASGQVIVASGIVSSGTFAAPSGSVSAPGIYFNNDSNTGLYSPAADTIAFTEGGVEALRIDSSGRVGIGTSAPDHKMTVADTSNYVVMNLKSSVSEFAALHFGDTDEPGQAAIVYDNSSDQLNFATNRSASIATDMCIDSSGRVGIGTSTPDDTLHLVGATGYGLKNTDGTHTVVLRTVSGGGILKTASNHALVFGTNDTERARIDNSGRLLVGTSTSQGSYNLQCFGTGVWGQGAYVNGSDVNIKQNIQDLEPALDVIKAMRPVTFQYKEAYSSDQTVQPGFIAQELQKAMAGKAYVDGVVQQGATHLNVAYSSIIAVLVKAVQELEAKVAALESA